MDAAHAIDAEVRLYDMLYSAENPDEGELKEALNPSSLVIMEQAKCEPFLASVKYGDKFQFLRTGYFCVDIDRTKTGGPVFNRTVSLKDTWAKLSANW